ncbi:unnamed protein product [Dimorphilus gyrociliatus]|uniref:Uncharacterized protein n=1 Tax=Dimorphilus gyrociliatus TaxID=2664684 RepID=A0A7I8VFW4_9ANNE|nr:unnamed protein product [Dimorphilus gyrociliatus]
MYRFTTQRSFRRLIEIEDILLGTMDETTADMQEFEIQKSYIDNTKEMAEEIINKLKKIDEEKENETSKLNYEITKLVVSIRNQQSSVQDQLNNFYEKKRTMLYEIYENIRKLDKLAEGDSEENNTNNFLTIMSRVNTLTDSFKRKEEAYLKTAEFFDGSTIGRLFFTTPDVPVHEYSIVVEEKPIKVISNSESFFTIQGKNRIINLRNQVVLGQVADTIDDIAITSDGRLSFIIVYNWEESAVNILPKGTHKPEAYKLENAFLRSGNCKFTILNDKIVVGDGNLTSIFSTESRKREKVWRLWSSSQHYKIKDNTLYQLSDNTWVSYTDNQLGEFRQVHDYSDTTTPILKVLIRKLVAGNILFCLNDYITLIDPDKKNAISIKMQLIFPDKTLLDYQIKNDEVILCLHCNIDPCKISFMHFPYKFILN